MKKLSYELTKQVAPALEASLRPRGSVLAMPSSGAGILLLTFFRHLEPEVYQHLQADPKWFVSAPVAREEGGFRLLIEPNYFWEEKGSLRVPTPKDDAQVKLVTHRGGPLYYSVVHTYGTLGALWVTKEQVLQSIVPAFFPKAEVLEKTEGFSNPLPKVGPWID